MQTVHGHPHPHPPGSGVRPLPRSVDSGSPPTRPTRFSGGAWSHLPSHALGRRKQGSESRHTADRQRPLLPTNGGEGHSPGGSGDLERAAAAAAATAASAPPAESPGEKLTCKQAVLLRLALLDHNVNILLNPLLS